ncbi:RNA polymerase sigma factor [Pedobacter frigoris]|uniref:RNA polymerase sigma factor n=1 Tax=Pedobacter frigoris TaxID=2571272 RepID=UPI0021D0B3D3|nr:sigma factor-like helix-turn-helix DNA-binding protein [Pedobacter frigoris]
MRNNVFRALKKEGRFIPIDDLLVEVQLFYPDADSDLLKKEFFKTYDALVNAMPPARQKIFRMHYHENLSTKEIAEMLKLSRGTVQNQLPRQ